MKRGKIKMKQLTQEELNRRISQHEKWLAGDKDGKKLWISTYEDASGLDFSG